jgi:hypothetical protein
MDACTIGTGTAVGANALGALTTGVNNTAVGTSAGAAVTTGSNNAFLGYNAGNDAMITATTTSNIVIIGNNTTAYIGGKVAWTTISDVRDKTDVRSVAVGLEYINRLNAVSWRFDDRGWYKDKTPDGSKACSIQRVGFIAQDIQKIEEELGLPFNHVLNKDNPDRLALTMNNFIPIITNAIKELSSEIQKIKNVLNIY